MTCFVILQCAVDPKGEAGESPVCPIHNAVTPFVRLRLRWFVQSSGLNNTAHPAFVGWFWVVPSHQSCCPCTLASLFRLLLKDTLLCGHVS